MATDLVPLGKYKGQPVTALAQDRPYCDQTSNTKNISGLARK